MGGILEEYEDTLISSSGKMFVYLKGISYSELSSVLELLYYSKTSVEKANLDGLYSVLEELEINPSVLGLECSEKRLVSKEAKLKETKSNINKLEDEIHKILNSPIKNYTSSVESMIEETNENNEIDSSTTSQIAKSTKGMNNNNYDKRLTAIMNSYITAKSRNDSEVEEEEAVTDMAKLAEQDEDAKLSDHNSNLIDAAASRITINSELENDIEQQLDNTSVASQDLFNRIEHVLAANNEAIAKIKKSDEDPGLDLKKRRNPGRKTKEGTTELRKR